MNKTFVMDTNFPNHDTQGVDYTAMSNAITAQRGFNHPSFVLVRFWGIQAMVELKQKEKAQNTATCEDKEQICVAKKTKSRS